VISQSTLIVGETRGERVKEKQKRCRGKLHLLPRAVTLTEFLCAARRERLDESYSIGAAGRGSGSHASAGSGEARAVSAWRRFSLGLSVFLLLAIARPGHAMRRCGDDVDGHGTAVPCACGDLLVSSRALGAADRLTHTRCRAMGLLVAAPGPVTLAFGGRTLRGAGQGVGVLVVRGSLALQGPGAIEGFGTGVLARGPRALASVVGLRFRRNRLSGLLAESDGYTVEGSVAEHNGQDGFALGGRGYALDGNRAAGNRRHGFNLGGRGAHVGGGLGNEAVANGQTGFWLHGMLHQVLGATAVGNGRDGVYGRVMHALLADVRAERNGRAGLWATGAAIAIEGNEATANRGFGVWAMGRDIDDRGGNRGMGNAGIMGPVDAPPSLLRDLDPGLLQCRIGMTGACR